MRSKRSNNRLNLSSQAKVRSTRIRNVWMAALKKRLRPRFVVLRLRGFSLMLGIMPALKRTIRSKAKLLLHGMKSLCYGDPAAGNSEALGNQEEHYGVSLACGDNMQTDGVGSCGALVPGLRPFDAGVRPPVACALDVRRADPGGQPSGALSRPRVPESGADL